MRVMQGVKSDSEGAYLRYVTEDESRGQRSRMRDMIIRQEEITELKGRMGDALALGGEEGRDKLRKAVGSGTYTEIRGYPNGATRRERSRHQYKTEANAGN